MKGNMLLASLFLICATGSLMSMEQKNNDIQRINFLLGHYGKIKKYSAENMEYGMLPPEFVGKKMTKVVRLNDVDHKAMRKAFKDAAQQQKTMTVSYIAENKSFLATITPLIYMRKDKQRNNFFVKITPNKSYDSNLLISNIIKSDIIL